MYLIANTLQMHMNSKVYRETKTLAQGMHRNICIHVGKHLWVRHGGLNNWSFEIRIIYEKTDFSGSFYLSYQGQNSKSLLIFHKQDSIFKFPVMMQSDFDWSRSPVFSEQYPQYTDLMFDTFTSRKNKIPGDESLAVFYSWHEFLEHEKVH